VDTPFCCCCKEDFAVDDKAPWTMGLMRHLKRAPKAVVARYRDWLEHPFGCYLCGKQVGEGLRPSPTKIYSMRLLNTCKR
jgi:hypothetical protein